MGYEMLNYLVFAVGWSVCQLVCLSVSLLESCNVYRFTGRQVNGFTSSRVHTFTGLHADEFMINIETNSA